MHLIASRRKLPSFYTVVEDDPSQLKIPREFLQHYQGNASHWCHLQTAAIPRLVHVEVVSRDIYFKTGWNEFLQDNGLHKGQLLVFHYDGNSIFHVDINGTDKCGELYEMQETRLVHDEDDHDVSVEILSSSCGSCPLPRKKHKASSVVKERGGPSSSRSKLVGMADMYEVHMRAEEFKLKNPSAFLVSVNSSCIKSKDLWLPKELAMLVKPRLPHTEQSDCATILRAIDGSNNDLKEGDVCAFMLIEDVKIVIDDEVFHMKESATRNLSPDISCEWEWEWEEETGDEDEDDASSKHFNYVPPVSETKAARLDEKMKNRTTSPTVGGASRHLSIDEEILRGIALNKAYAFKLKNVHSCFVVSLSYTYARGVSSSVPRRFAREHINHRRPTWVCLQVKGKIFPVKVSYIEGCTWLRAGWPEFVQANNLKMGDACVFVLSNAENFDFDVEIFRMTDAAGSSSQAGL